MQVTALDTNSSLVSTQAKGTALSIANTPEFFQVLNESFYSNPKLAICREVLANGWDSLKLNGNLDTPIEITITKNSIKFRDYGTGIPLDILPDVYLTYGKGNKRDDSTQIGGFGLGSKTPATYADTMTITTYHNGKKGIFLFVKASEEHDGCPAVYLQYEGETSETGLEVEFAINDVEDINTFKENLKFILLSTPYTIKINDGLFESPIKKELAQYKEKPYIICKTLPLKRNKYVIYGDLLYPVDLEELQKEDSFRDLWEKIEKHFYTLNVLGLHLIVKLPPDSISLHPSRESLVYNEQTKNTLYEQYFKVHEELLNIKNSFSFLDLKNYLKENIEEISSIVMRKGRERFLPLYNKDLFFRMCTIQYHRNEEYYCQIRTLERFFYKLVNYNILKRIGYTTPYIEYRKGFKQHTRYDHQNHRIPLHYFFETDIKYLITPNSHEYSYIGEDNNIYPDRRHLDLYNDYSFIFNLFSKENTTTVCLTNKLSQYRYKSKENLGIPSSHHLLLIGCRSKKAFDEKLQDLKKLEQMDYNIHIETLWVNPPKKKQTTTRINYDYLTPIPSTTPNEFYVNDLIEHGFNTKGKYGKLRDGFKPREHKSSSFDCVFVLKESTLCSLNKEKKSFYLAKLKDLSEQLRIKVAVVLDRKQADLLKLPDFSQYLYDALKRQLHFPIRKNYIHWYWEEILKESVIDYLLSQGWLEQYIKTSLHIVLTEKEQQNYKDYINEYKHQIDLFIEIIGKGYSYKNILLLILNKTQVSTILKQINKISNKRLEYYEKIKDTKIQGHDVSHEDLKNFLNTIEVAILFSGLVKKNPELVEEILPELLIKHKTLINKARKELKNASII